MSDTITSTIPAQAGDATVATAQPMAPGNLVSGDATLAAPMGVSEQSTQGKTISLPTSAFAKLKAEAAEKGKKAALTEMQAKAKAFGFDSVDAMFEALQTARGSEAVETQQETRAAHKAAPVQQPKQSGSKDTVAAEAIRIAKEMERARKEAEKASREARRYRQELEEYQAQAEMKEVLLRAGVRDEVDYALTLMRKDIQTKLETDPELASYSTDEFLKSLRQTKPFLFGESRLPATTGTGGEGPQARPAAPGQAAATIAQSEQFDARKATSEQIKARLAQLGVQYSRQ